MIEIISKEEQPLLGRTFVKATVGFSGVTPNRKDIRSKVAKETKTQLQKVIIRNIKAGFGEKTAHIDALLYKDVKDAEALETKKLMEKHKIEEPKKEEASAEGSEEKKEAAEKTE